MTAPAKGPLEALGADTGMPIYLGTIIATGTSLTNSQATPAFNATGDLLAGKTLLVCNAGTVEASIYPVATATATVTRTRAAGANFGVPIAAGELRTLRMGSGAGFLAAITDGSTANIDVWEMV